MFFAKISNGRMTQLESKIEGLEKELLFYDENCASNSVSVKILLKYESANELTEDMFRELVDRVKCYTGYVDVKLKFSVVRETMIKMFIFISSLSTFG